MAASGCCLLLVFAAPLSARGGWGLSLVLALLQSTLLPLWFCNHLTAIMRKRELVLLYSYFVCVFVSGPEVIKHFSCSTQLSMVFQLHLKTKC